MLLPLLLPLLSSCSRYSSCSFVCPLVQVDLTEEKAFLKERVTAILCEEGQDDEEVEDQDQKIVEKNEQQEGREEEEQEREEEDVKPANRAEAKQAGKAKPKAADQQLSPALFEFMGGKENLMTRGDVSILESSRIRSFLPHLRRRAGAPFFRFLLRVGPSVFASARISLPTKYACEKSSTIEHPIQ